MHLVGFKTPSFIRVTAGFQRFNLSLSDLETKSWQLQPHCISSSIACRVLEKQWPLFIGRGQTIIVCKLNTGKLISFSFSFYFFLFCWISLSLVILKYVHNWNACKRSVHWLTFLWHACTLWDAWTWGIYCWSATMPKGWWLDNSQIFSPCPRGGFLKKGRRRTVEVGGGRH